MPVTIKRYPNRKLYDTSARQYITLVDIAGLIRRGHEVVIIDHASGEDLTALTLTQVISELEKRPGGFLPHPVLSGLIKSGEARLENLRQELAAHNPLSGYAAAPDQVDEEIERRVGLLVARQELGEAEAARLIEKLTTAGRLAAKTGPLRESRLVKSLVERGVPSRRDLLYLLEQLDDLSKKVDQISGQKSPDGRSEENSRS
jgi:polyhydroxyalkanoate synthesis repressor PhaR